MSDLEYDQVRFSSNVFSPYEEMVAYETLWGMHNQSLAKLSTRWESHSDLLPSQLLSEWEGLAPQEDLRVRVREYLDNRISARGINFSVSVNGTFQYPEQLKQAQHPVRFFYFKGDIDLATSPCVSVVGTRGASADGKARARKLVKMLVEHGLTIVSGLAEGIDTAAMTAAIEFGGRVIGVIGTPIDKYFPAANRGLQDQVAQEHLLISHVPFYRYETEPFKFRKLHFPERNETMAALSMATIIVEASDTSGTLTQARACLHQGRQLFILNSCFDVPGLKWPHSFVTKGARRVRDFDDILKALPSSPHGPLEPA